MLQQRFYTAIFGMLLFIASALTYAKSDISQSYDVRIGEDIVHALPFRDKKEAQKYFVLR